MEAGHESANYADEEEHGEEKERDRVSILDAYMHTYLLVEDSIIGELSQSHIRCLCIVP